MRRVLQGKTLVCAGSVAHAMRELQGKRFALVVLGVDFDESRMFDLLRHVRVDAGHKRVPVACVLGEASRLSHVMVEGLDQAVKALMANAFLVLANFPDDENGNGRLRRIFDALIAIDGDMHQGLE